MSDAKAVKLAPADTSIGVVQSRAMKPKRKKFRHVVIATSFVLIVVAPFVVGAVYLFTMASDQYHSDSAFAVRAEEAPNPLDVIGAFTQTGGSSSPDAEILYDLAMEMVGLPYRWGGDDMLDGFDCSGLVLELYQSVGILPRGVDMNAAGLWQFPGFERLPQNEVSFGTLVFFGDVKAPTHVGFCLNDRLMLEAGSGDSKTVDRATAAKQNAYVRVRPISNRKDLVGFKRPSTLKG